jgi:hypothetical protein
LLYGRRASKASERRQRGQEEEEPRFLNLLRVILQLSNALVKIFKARAALDATPVMMPFSRTAVLSSGREKAKIFSRKKGFVSYLASFAGVHSVVES